MEPKTVDLYYSSNQYASLDKNGRSGELMSISNNQKAARLVGYIRGKIHTESENSYLSLDRDGWSAFVKIENPPDWIEKYIYPRGWKAEK